MIFVFISGVEPQISWFLVPLYIAELFIFALALGFFLSALFVKYRDASYVWEIGLQAGFYATPILYPLSIVAGKYQKFIMLNPVAQIVQDSRWALVSHDTLTSWKVLDGLLILIPFILIVVSVAVAIRYFKKESKYFAERI
jgi:ABC-2 type transport system permease protein